MKLKLALTAIFIFVELLLAFLPNLPYVDGIAPNNPSPQDAMNFQVNMLGLNVTVLVAYMGLLTLLGEKDRQEFQNELTASLAACKVDILRDDEFYEHFIRFVKDSAHSVYICYFAPFPPADIQSHDRQRYYREILTQIRNRQEVHFRRIIRRSAANDAWTTDLVRNLEGKPNIDIAILDEGDEIDQPRALSVQVIDNTHVWLVALESHERLGQYRDVYIGHPQVADALTKYFSRLWDRSVVVLDHGRITPKGQTLLQAHPKGEADGR